jgi:hypothetical protein
MNGVGFGSVVKTKFGRKFKNHFLSKIVFKFSLVISNIEKQELYSTYKWAQYARVFVTGEHFLPCVM